MIKFIARLIVTLVVLVVLAVAAAWYFADSLAKTGVEQGGSYAMGVPTTVKELTLSLLQGTLTMDGLRVANPAGFEGEHALQTGRFDLALRPASLFGDTVEVSKFELDGLDVQIVQRLDGTNVGKILESLQRFGGQGGREEAPVPEEDQPGKRVKVDRIVIRNVTGTFHLLPETGAGQKITVRVPEVVLSGVSSDGSGVAMGELLSRIVPAVMEALLEKGEGRLPANLLANLESQVHAAAGPEAQKLLDQAERSIDPNLAKDARKTAQDALNNLLGQ